MPDCTARPWNDHTCRVSGISDAVHLTFVDDDPLPEGRLRQVIYRARTAIREDIAFDPTDGLEPNGMMVWSAKESEQIIEPGDVIIAARPAKKPTFVPAWHKFLYVDLLKAVELIEWCTIAHRRTEAMWAYVYLREVHIGYIWTKRYRPEDPTLQNATADM